MPYQIKFLSGFYSLLSEHIMTNTCQTYILVNTSYTYISKFLHVLIMGHIVSSLETGFCCLTLMACQAQYAVQAAI